jgi:hypothetical protein
MLIYNCPKDRKVVNKMNIENYTMDFEDRKNYVMDRIFDVIDNDSDIFVRMCEEIDNWNGLLGDARCEYMDEIDEFFSKPSELLDRMDDFKSSDEYFYFNGYGNVCTTSDKFDIYEDEVSIDELIDEIIDNYQHIDIDDTQLRELVEIVINEDFGIEEDAEIDEDMDEDDAPEETDDEFKDRIDNI